MPDNGPDNGPDDGPRSRPDGAAGGADAGTSDEEPPRYVRIGNALLAVTEDVIYVGIAVVLAVSAVALLISAVRGLTELTDTGASDVVLEVLDRLLLVFIVVELLFAVRVILGKRQVVAEPFLIVGIIASIKEIIVLSVKAADYVGKDDKFVHAIVEVGVLGGLVIVLAGAAIILRAKEREPQEGKDDAGRQSRKDGEALKVGQGDPTGS
jgi:uncharacterized membrane protein (DUF373 family)